MSDDPFDEAGVEVDGPSPSEPRNELQFDPDDLVERLMGNEDIAKRVTAAFLDSMPGKLMALADAINRFDASAAQRVAHTIKGAAANVGSVSMQNLAAKLEQLGEEGALVPAARIMPGLSATFESVKPAMQRFCEGDVKPRR